tara:strand:- start:7019 stop:9274 length:2256 start_codon:yes stop_codon:yes gene_type:complete
MKPTVANPNSLKSRGIESSVKFGIKASGLHHILGILRNQLYSDKVLAVLREYTCNAVDAHTVVGKEDTPIEVTLPTKLNLTYKVRDFGPALSDDEIQDVYAFYGESTKRNTNDQIGMLGIGSKSAFAYGDNFVINSYLDGVKNIYNAFIDPSQVGQISKIGEEPTKEPNGIEIVVPVREDDVSEFESKAKKLFKHFKVRPKVKGVAEFDYEDDAILFSGETWEWRDVRGDYWRRRDNAVVVMGNIGYPFESSDLNLRHDDKIYNLVVENLLLKVPIGDLEISASREKLQFTDYTRAQLKKHLQKVVDELSAIVGKQFKECKTMFDAKCLYGTVFRTDSPLYQLRHVLKEHLFWNGKAVDDDSYSTWGMEAVELHRFSKTARSDRYRPVEAGNFSCERNTVIIENDIGHRRGLLGRVLPLLLTDKKIPHLIEFSSFTKDDGKTQSAEQTKKLWIKNQNFDGEFLKLSELPKHKLSEFDGYSNASGSGSSYGSDAKHSAKCFEFDFDYDGRSWNRKKSDWWKIADLDIENESGVFVILESFKIQNLKSEGYNSFRDPHSISHLKEELEQIGIEFPKHVYAFKIKDAHKVEGKSGWTNLYDWVELKLNQKIKDDKLTQVAADTLAKSDFLKGRREYNFGYYFEEFITSFVGEVSPKLALKDGEAANFAKEFEAMSHDEGMVKIVNAVRELARNYSVEFSTKDTKPLYDLSKSFKKLLKKYSMLSLVDGRRLESVEIDKITNYVNVIDLCNARKV